MRLVGCIRVSRVGGRAGETFISPDVQRDQITVYARSRGHEIVAWQEDLDQPGSTLNRPGLRAALELVDAGEADGLIAAKLDRLTRSIVDLGKLLARAQEGGWNLVAVDVGLDLGTPNGKLVAHVLGAVAEWELDRRRADWQQARARAVGRGVHIASRTPTGYRRSADGRLEPDPATAEAVRELFELRAAGVGWTQLAQFMTGEAVVTPYGNERWTNGAVQKLIRNRVYLGEARSGAYVTAGAHEPLVDRAVWEAAQQARTGPSARTAEPELLSGLVRCGGCRYVAKAEHHRDRNGDRLGVYRCRGHHAAGQCAGRTTILARILDPIVEERFLDWLREGGHAADASIATRELTDARAELDAADADLLAYVASDALALAGAEAFGHGLVVRRRRVDEARERVRAAQSRVVTIERLTPGELLNAWPGLSVDQKRRVLAAALDAVVVWRHRSGRPVGERVRLVFRGQAPADLPRRGRRVPLAPWPEGPFDVGVELTEDR